MTTCKYGYTCDRENGPLPYYKRAFNNLYCSKTEHLTCAIFYQPQWNFTWTEQGIFQKEEQKLNCVSFRGGIESLEGFLPACLCLLSLSSCHPREARLKASTRRHSSLSFWCLASFCACLPDFREGPFSCSIHGCETGWESYWHWKCLDFRFGMLVNRLKMSKGKFRYCKFTRCSPFSPSPQPLCKHIVRIVHIVSLLVNPLLCLLIPGTLLGSRIPSRHICPSTSSTSSTSSTIAGAYMPLHNPSPPLSATIVQEPICLPPSNPLSLFLQLIFSQQPFSRFPLSLSPSLHAKEIHPSSTTTTPQNHNNHNNSLFIQLIFSKQPLSRFSLCPQPCMLTKSIVPPCHLKMRWKHSNKTRRKL